MNTITRNFTAAVDAAIVEGKVRDLARRAAKKGIGTDLRADTEIIVERNEVTGEDDTTYRVTVTFSDLVRFTGGWELVAVADATGTDEPLIFTVDDDTTIDNAVDMLRCDHCARRVRRNKVLFIRNDNGDEMQVGGSCAQDFLGHDPWWTTILFDAVDGDIDDEMRASGRTEFPVEVVIAAAIEANRLGYHKGTSESGTPTKQTVIAMLHGDFYNHKDWARDRAALAEAPRATVTVEQVLDYMRSQDGEFGTNLRRVADSTYIGAKAFGIAAYAPAGAVGWREEMARKAEERAAAEAARANAESVPSGKVVVEGRVTTVRAIENEYGRTWKMRVETAAGWAVWGTVPKALSGKWEDVEEDDGYISCRTTEEPANVGDRVRFTATIEPSGDDHLFGFFKRPTKAEIIERAQVSC